MNSRIKFLNGCILLGALIVLSRLFYWQIIQSSHLKVEAQTQRTSVETIDAARGDILSSDGYKLVTNRPVYLLYAYKPQLQQTPLQISQQLAPILLEEPKDATEAAKPLTQRIAEIENNLLKQLSDPQRKWIPLSRNLSNDVKMKIEELGILGLGFDQNQRRYYPEASMSAHLIGFVGRDEKGSPQGYFGLEGFYNLEMQGRSGQLIQEKDAIGLPILIGLFKQKPSRSGRSLELHLNRSLQYLVEQSLADGLQKYGATSGEVIMMDPKTGAIIAMASQPSYDPATFNQFDTGLYKNPVVADTYEPGSTFKALVMAAGIDAGVITPETYCDDTCDGPVTIGKYTIRTWNNEYNPGQNMKDVLARSDNTGMIYVARKLGKERFVQYLDTFGLTSSTGIDLQEESIPFFRDSWGDIDLATASFGQGIALTGIHMVRAISVIANGGNLVEPQVVAKVHGETELPIQPRITPNVISPEAARQATEMMVYAAHKGEAQWTVMKNYDVAGKTGTAQIPIDGHYDEDKTMASFIGFVPAYDPKFVMLVKLREPQSSPWASETAAPLWYNIASQALLTLNVAPTK